MTTYVVASKANTPYLAEVSYLSINVDFSAKSWVSSSRRTPLTAECSTPSKIHPNGLNLSIQFAALMGSQKKLAHWSTPSRGL